MPRSVRHDVRVLLRKDWPLRKGRRFGDFQGSHDRLGGGAGRKRDVDVLRRARVAELRCRGGDGGVFVDEPAVLLAQHTDFLPEQAGLFLLLCEFGFDVVDVVLGPEQVPAPDGETLPEHPVCGLRAPSVEQGQLQLIGEASRLLFQTMELLLGDPLGSLVLGAHTGQLFLEMVALDGGGAARRPVYVVRRSVRARHRRV
ncbi:hypothetical protein OG592_37235 [Streptomyces avidinii]|uniref:hypothetical protein n=1 Tax=Streptomyces avidinii TaxID=1895 RepID=UPI00386D212F|nr:hypothetical protein OG592_37235 [Streptomyces avidinii]